MAELQDRIEETKRRVFLRRVCELSGRDASVPVSSGRLGQELGLPYEQALEIVDELDRRGWLRRGEALLPPDGPVVHLTSRGIDAALLAAA